MASLTINQLRDMISQQLEERCQKGYKTHPKRKTKKMYGKTYRNCVKAESVVNEDHPYSSDYSDVYIVVAYNNDGQIETLKNNNQEDQIYDKEKDAQQAAINATAKSYPSKSWFSKSVEDLLRVLPPSMAAHGRIKQRAQTLLDMSRFDPPSLNNKKLPESMERRTYKVVMYDKDGKEKIINVHDTTDEARARQVAANTFIAKSHGWTFDPPTDR